MRYATAALGAAADLATCVNSSGSEDFATCVPRTSKVTRRAVCGRCYGRGRLLGQQHSGSIYEVTGHAVRNRPTRRRRRLGYLHSREFMK